MAKLHLQLLPVLREVHEDRLRKRVIAFKTQVRAATAVRTPLLLLLRWLLLIPMSVMLLGLCCFC